MIGSKIGCNILRLLEIFPRLARLSLFALTLDWLVFIAFLIRDWSAWHLLWFLQCLILRDVTSQTTFKSTGPEKRPPCGEGWCWSKRRYLQRLDERGRFSCMHRREWKLSRRGRRQMEIIGRSFRWNTNANTRNKIGGKRSFKVRWENVEQ